MKNRSLVLLIILISCSSTKKEVVKEMKSDCYVTKVDSYKLPKEIKESTANLAESFSNSNYELQILHTKVIQGYDYKVDSRIIYFENNRFYIKDNQGNIEEMNDLKFDIVSEKLDQIGKQNYVAFCNHNSSSKEINQFYLKQKDEITFSFVLTGKGLHEIDTDLSKNEISFIKLFI
ncbi:hypothetical protein [uncultured Aquimarina sp.]|uniref:hypothetical protein n=1 Tax=uncultured Aquimarina sp. TaxID=575652 RepID=UPI002638D81C|nr:hypothetical protein [uncultured Aquimarina sp.]